MSKVLEKATAHFRNKIGGEMVKIHVPEWECDIYFRTTSTLKEESKIVELSQQGKTVEALVETLITKARNQDGSKMFTFADKMVFMNEVDPQVIIRISSDIGAAVGSANVDDAEKN